MDFKEYLERKELSASGVKKLLRSPAYFLWSSQNEQKETKALLFGRAIHSAILTPNLFEKEYVCGLNKEKYKYVTVDDLSDLCKKYEIKKSNKKSEIIKTLLTVINQEESSQIYDLALEKFLENSKGKQVLSTSDYQECHAISKSVLSSPKVAQMLKNGEAEISYSFEIDGVKMKARLDFKSMLKFFLDVKTTKDCSPEGFAREFYKYGYDIQMWLYQEAIFQNEGVRIPCIILAVEKDANYDYRIFEIDQAWLDLGERRARKLIALYKECLEKNEWPGYDKKIQGLPIPAYVKLDQ